MPRVPQAREARVVESNIQAPLSRVGVSREALGGGRALRGLSEVEKIFAEEKRNADNIASLEANSKLAEAETFLLSDPETGALNQRGKNALNLGESVNENFDKRAKEIEEGLTNDAQRQSFRRSLAARRDNVNRKIQGHISREKVKFDNEVTDSFIRNEANAAALNFNDPDRVQQSIELQKAAVEDHADRNGLPAEAVKLRKLEVASNTHSNVITKMLSGGDSDRAEKYFKKNRKEFTASDLATIEKDLATAGLRKKSQRVTDSIVESSVTLTEGLDKARQVQDPRLRDETVKRVRQRFEEQSRARRIDDETNYRSVSDLAKQVRSVDGIPPNQWNRLTLEQQNRMANHIRNLNRGLSPPKNSERYYDLINVASANPSSFMQKNLLEDQDKIDESQLSQLIKMQADMRNGKGAANRELKGFETKNQVLENLLVEIDIDPRAKRGTDKEKTLIFRQALDERVLEFEEQNKRKPNNNEIRKLGKELQLEVVTDRGLIYNTEKRIFLLDPEDRPSIAFEEIPEQEVAKIREAISRRGTEPTDEQVLMLYVAKLERIRTRANK